MRSHVAAMLLALLLGSSSATAQDVRQRLDAALDANRNGRWQEAVDLLAPVLETQDLPELQLAEALALSAYAERLVGDPARVVALQERFATLKTIPEGHWTRREIVGAAPGAVPSAVRESANWNWPTLQPDDTWDAASAADTGLDPAFLDAHLQLCREGGADAALVVHEGRIVQEWYALGQPSILGAMSSTKSITALLVGLALEDGKLPSIEEPVGRWLPEWKEGLRGRVTVRHLLEQTSGLLNRAARGELDVGGVGDKNAHVLALQPEAEPGASFSYSNEGVHLLSPLLDAALGEPLHLYAERRLFAPLGLRNTRLRLDEAGHAWTYGDMLTTPRDLARLGQCMLDGGVHGGRQVLPAEWLRRCVAPSERRPDHGLLWWLHPETGGFAAQGYLGTDVHVFPGRGLVVVRMQQRPGEDGSPEAAYRGELHRLVAQHVPAEG